MNNRQLDTSWFHAARPPTPSSVARAQGERMMDYLVPPSPARSTASSIESYVSHGHVGVPSGPPQIIGLPHDDSQALSVLSQFYRQALPEGEMLIRVSGNEHEKSQIKEGVRSNRADSIGTASRLQADLAIVQPQVAAVRYKIAHWTEQIKAMTEVVRVYDDMEKFSGELQDIIHLKPAASPKDLTVDTVKALYKRFINSEFDGPEKMRHVFGIPDMDALLEIKDKRVLRTILKAIAPYKNHPRFQPNLDKLIADGVLPTNFPRDRVISGVNHSFETFLWLNAFYLEVPGNDQFRGFQLRANMSISVWPNQPGLDKYQALLPVTMPAATAPTSSNPTMPAATAHASASSNPTMPAAPAHASTASNPMETINEGVEDEDEDDHEDDHTQPSAFSTNAGGASTGAGFVFNAAASATNPPSSTTGGGFVFNAAGSTSTAGTSESAGMSSGGPAINLKPPTFQFSSSNGASQSSTAQVPAPEINALTGRPIPQGMFGLAAMEAAANRPATEAPEASDYTRRREETTSTFSSKKKRKAEYQGGR